MSTFTKIFTHKNFPFLELRYSNNTRHYKEHIHDTFSVGINLNNKSIYTNKDKKYELDIGSLAIVNPKEIHSCNPISGIANLYYMMFLDKTWCYEIQKSIDEECNNFIPFPKNILYDENLYKEFKTLCETIFSATDDFEKENKLINFFIKFFEPYLNSSQEKTNNSDLKKMQKYLEKNYQESISLDDLSKEFNLNPFYIIRLFKSQINITPHAYLLNIKINKAKQLIKSGLPLVQTALECGFTDQSHFHRNFLKIVATTPKQYQLNFIQD